MQRSVRRGSAISDSSRLHGRSRPADVDRLRARADIGPRRTQGGTPHQGVPAHGCRPPRACRTARNSDVDRRRSENRSAMASTRSVAPAARACSYSASSESGTSKRTSPSVGFSSRMRQRPTVLLPDPLSPTRPTTCSFWIFRPTSSTALSEVVARNAPRTGKNLLSPYAAIIMLLPLVEPAGDQLIIPLPEVDRHDTVALFKSEGTSGVEGATRRRGAHVRYLPLDSFDRFPLQGRNRGDEHLRVRMQGVVENLGRRSDLHDAARVHDRDSA